VHRHILGVVAVTLAAPYLIILAGFLFNKEGGPDPLFLIHVATVGLVLLGPPTLVLAGICAAILHRLKLQTRSWCMLGGAGVSLVFLGVLEGLMLHLLLSGAVCGWIYWRIALKNPVRKDLLDEALSEGSPPRRHKPLGLRRLRSVLFFNRRVPSWKSCGRPSC